MAVRGRGGGPASVTPSSPANRAPGCRAGPSPSASHRDHGRARRSALHPPSRAPRPPRARGLTAPPWRPPAARGGEPIGALGAASVRGRVFDDEARALLEAFADQAAVALHSARLFRAERQARAEAQALERRFHRSGPRRGRRPHRDRDAQPPRAVSSTAACSRCSATPSSSGCGEPDFSGARTSIPRTASGRWRSTKPAIASGGDFVHEYRMVTGDGRTVWIRDSVTVAPERLHSLQRSTSPRASAPRRCWPASRRC